MRPLLFFWLLGPFLLAAQERLTVDQCRDLAETNSPLQQRKALAATAAALQVRNLRANDLPRIALSAQATWQSDVFSLPFESPAFPAPDVPKDQYRLAADVGQRIWDGGSDRYLRRQRELERDVVAAQVDVETFQLRELVTELFFRVLLLQETDTILGAGAADLRNRLRQAEAQVQEGVALRTTADQVRIQWLKTEQQRQAVQADRRALARILAVWIGRDSVDFVLEPPETSAPAAPLAGAADRPEYRLFQLQQRQLELGRDQLALRVQPRLEAFAQGGLGRPNPFNFFETDLQPFLLVGLRAAWTPFDWGNRRRDAEVLTLQGMSIDAQRAAFDRRLEATLLRDREESEKAAGQIRQDDAIIGLQEDIVRRAEAQVANGVMTTTDYLAQLNLLLQARLNRKTHELQAAQAVEMERAKRR
jgi:outer membrane protein TolC